jgi:hypothetical protein
MQLASKCWNRTAQMEAPIEQPHGLPLRLLVHRLFLPYKEFNLLGEETTDGRRTTGGDKLHLLVSLPG